MEQRCTCGAVLPDDARFCHKCGRPQLEEDLAREQAQFVSQSATIPVVPIGAAQTPAAASHISFRNSRAVLISLLVAAGALIGLFAMGMVLPPLIFLVLCAAGFVAARIYRGQSSEPLSPAEGARLGWMTGLWLFLVVAIFCAIAAIFVASPEGWQQVKNSWAQVPQAAELASLSQHEFLMKLLIGLPFSFFLLTLLPGLGGMLGAKLPARSR